MVNLGATKDAAIQATQNGYRFHKIILMTKQLDAIQSFSNSAELPHWTRRHRLVAVQ